MRRRYLALVPVAIVCVIALPWSGAEQLADAMLIATVNGEPVTYERIRVKAKVVLARFRRIHERAPETEADRDAMERDMRESEAANLAVSIRAAVRRQQTTRFGIDPTEQEIEERWRQWELEREAEGERIDRGAMAREGKKNLRQLLKALEEVIDQGHDADIVYERRLTGKMSREEWRLRLQHEGTPEKRKHLERLLSVPDEELFNLHDGFRRVVLGEQLDKAIEDELARTDPEFRDYINLAATDPGNARVQSKGHNYRIAKRYEWWQQRYREAKVEIKVGRFKDAWKEPFE